MPSPKHPLLKKAKKDTTWRKAAAARREKDAWQSMSFDIAVRILSVMKERGVNPVQLAAQLGITPLAVNKIVKGKENLTLETIHKLGEALGVSLVEVV